MADRLWKNTQKIPSGLILEQHHAPMAHKNKLWCKKIWSMAYLGNFPNRDEALKGKSYHGLSGSAYGTEKNHPKTVSFPFGAFKL